MHRLDGAYEQVNGAREHLDTLKPLIRNLTQEVANGVSLDYKMGISTIEGRRRRVPIGTATMTQVATPARVSRLSGEVIQNLRTALNYLTYELTCFDAKSIVDRTQFPIADTPEKFEQLLRRYNLRGNLSGEHIAAIERLQLYKGCNWTKWLAEFSNPHKHETLTVVRSPVVVSIDPRITKAILAGGHVDVNSYASIAITFSDGKPVIEHLEQLISQVAKTLRDFHPEFQRR